MLNERVGKTNEASTHHTRAHLLLPFGNLSCGNETRTHTHKHTQEIHPPPYRLARFVLSLVFMVRATQHIYTNTIYYITMAKRVMRSVPLTSSCRHPILFNVRHKMNNDDERSSFGCFDTFIRKGNNINNGT